jgi:multicomponent Na+:H+ antiporter subunit D
MAVLVSGMALLVAPFCKVSVAAEIEGDRHYLFYALLLLCLSGLLGIALTGDAFNVFVFLEISSLATYVLIALGRDRRAVFSAYQYLIMGTIGATLYIIGVGLLYLLTGTLNLADMAVRLQDIGHTPPVLAAVGFITVGVSLKIALFPLHTWLPNAYTYAPSAVSAFLAATATKVSVYVLLRFYFTIFGVDFVFGGLPAADILLGLSLAAMFIASAVAVFQFNLKRLLAYSSVAQIGYITLGISLGSTLGVSAGVIHILNHAMTKGALFLLLGGVALRLGGVTMSHIAGLGRTMPVTAAAFVIGGLGLIGVPGTAGFISKWYLLLAAIEQSLWWVVAAILASSLLAVAYVWKFVEAAYFREPEVDVRHGEPPLSMLLPSLLMVVMTIYFGINAGLTSEVAQRAAQSLLGGWQ